MGARSTYTQGGIHKYGLESLDAQNTDSKFGHPEFTTLFEKHLHSNREGFYGWQGYGGKVFQWHPQLNIGFAYDPNRMADSFAYPLGFELPDSEYYIARWSVTDGKRGLLNGEFKFSIGDDAIPPSEVIASKVSDAVESLPSTGSYRVVPKD